MGLGEKAIHTGIVRCQRVDVGTSNEHDGHVLDTGHGPALELKLKPPKSFHAFTQAHLVLDALDGKRVSVNGIAGSGVAAIFIDNITDIKLLGPPARPMRPPTP